jgi:DNA polymerase-3 subunit beta
VEITVRKSDLLKELLQLQGAVERKTTMPILSNILAEAMPDGRLALAATDLETGLQTSCAAKVKVSGACALPARKLLDYVKLLPEAELTIKRLENHWVQLRCGRANTRMVGMSRENFPELPAFPTSGIVRLPSVPLRAMIQKTIFAISSEETRYTLNGALLVAKPSSLCLVATDGHRLAHVVQEQLTLEGVGAELKALIPKKALAELLGLLDAAEEGDTIEFGQDETSLFFRLPIAGSESVRVLTARKLTGQFPNYEAVLPKSHLHAVPLNRDEFQRSIQRVAQFADERSHAIRVRFEANKLVLASSASDMGESNEELDTTFEGEPLVIGFNANYLDEFLDAVTEDEIVLEFKDDSSAGQLRPCSNDGLQYRYVVMPMRI